MIVNRDSDVLPITVDPRFLPEGEDDAIEVAVARDEEDGEVRVTVCKVREDKKVKVCVAGTKFAVEEPDQTVEVMLEFFRGKTAAFRDRKTLMFSAARVGRTEVLEALLEAHPEVDVNATNLRGETPLMLAVRSGQLGVVRELALRRAARPAPADATPDANTAGPITFR